MVTTLISTPEERAPINHFGRIVGALFSPKATFQDIARRPGWAAPIVLFSLLGLGFSWVMNQRVDWESFIRQQAEKSPRFAQLSEDQKQRAIGMQAKIAPMIGYGFGLCGPALVALILAGIYLGVDLFWIWALMLMGIGYASTNPMKISTGKAVGLVVGPWAVWVLVKVGWAAAFS
jgi:hypothetical protein